MFKYLNLNPLGRHVQDCTVRAIALATNRSWDEVYEELSHFAQKEAIILDDVDYIDNYLMTRFDRVCDCRDRGLTVGEFVHNHPKGIYIITMQGHITCAKDGIIYDIFDPSQKYIWEAYKVKEDSI